jgi:anti-sigma factor RsiW
MNCPIKTQENKERLLEYAAGRLANEQAALVARHVEHCAECGQLVQAQRQVWDALSQWKPGPVSADFDRRLYRKIDSQPVSWRDRLFRPLEPLWRPVVPLAAACLLIVAGVVLHTPRTALNPGDSPVRVEKIEAEQVERTLDDIQMLREMAVTPKQEGDSSKTL